MAPLKVDNSALSTLATCTFKAWLRYGMHRTTAEERKELLSGTAAHAALAAFFMGKGIAAALQAFDTVYRDWAKANVPADDRLSYENCRTILQQWFSLNQGKLPYTILPGMVEVYFEVPLDEHGDLVYCGIMDAVAEMAGHLYTLENKTTGNVDFKEAEFPLSSQLSGQCYGAMHGMVGGQSLALRLGHGTIAGSLVNAIEFKKLPGADTPDKKCRVHGTPYSECRVFHANCRLLGPYPRDQYHLDNWLADARLLANQFKDLLERAPDLSYAPTLAQEGTFTGACRFCEFKTVCIAGRNPGMIEANLVVNEWKPEEIATLRGA